MKAPYYTFSGISCTTGVITGLWFSSLYPPVESLINKVYSGISTSDIYTVINEPVQTLTRPTSVFVVPNTNTYGCPTYKLSCVGDCTYVNNVGYVNLGNQTWYTKNVAVTQYANGDEIPEVRDSTEWSRLTTGAWCYYNNDRKTGSKLYNWYAIKDPRGISDNNGDKIWIPSSNDWHVLSTFLGGDLISVNSLKQTGNNYWNSANTGATNSTCFSARGGGFRQPDGTFSSIKDTGIWWTFTQGSTGGRESRSGAYAISMMANSSQLGESITNFKSGFSIRGINVANNRIPVQDAIQNLATISANFLDNGHCPPYNHFDGNGEVDYVVTCTQPEFQFTLPYPATSTITIDFGGVYDGSGFDGATQIQIGDTKSPILTPNNMILNNNTCCTIITSIGFSMIMPIHDSNFIYWSENDMVPYTY